MEPWFARWTTRQVIDPKDERNLSDLKSLVRQRLKNGRYMTPTDLEAATSEMEARSEVRLVVDGSVAFVTERVSSSYRRASSSTPSSRSRS